MSATEECCNSVGRLIAGYCGSADDQGADVRDVLTDLIHFCAYTQMGFEDALASASANFEAEQDQELT